MGGRSPSFMYTSMSRTHTGTGLVPGRHQHGGLPWERSRGSTFGVGTGPTCKRYKGLLWTCCGPAELFLPLGWQLLGKGSRGLWVSGRRQGSRHPPRASTAVPSWPRPLASGAPAAAPLGCWWLLPAGNFQKGGQGDEQNLHHCSWSRSCK